MGNRYWTTEEDEYLREHWGKASLDTIAKNLGRTENAVLCRKEKLHLGAFLDNHPKGAVTLGTICAALKVRYTYYIMTSWAENRGLPVFTKKVRNCKFRMVELDKWWKWAEKNQDFLDFSRFEPLSLGPEPEWVSAKRSRDRMKKMYVNKTPWTKNEDERLIKYLRDNRYTVDEISKLLCRNNGAVTRRISTLGLKERPLKAYNHNNYTDTEIAMIKAMVSSGCNYYEISVKTGRSEKALRGLIYKWHKTERLDKARELMKAEGSKTA